MDEPIIGEGSSNTMLVKTLSTTKRFLAAGREWSGADISTELVQVPVRYMSMMQNSPIFVD